MNSFQRLSLMAILGGTALVASAQNANTGALLGHVQDGNNKLSLAGARVSIAAAGVETYTDSTGNFSFFYVKPGNYEVEVSYVGFQDLRFIANIQGGQTTRHEATFNEGVVSMERFVIEGSEVGSARALNSQRSAVSLSNVVAADEIGRFPDQNAAESMQRIPGIALYRDQGEGRYIVARGIRPDLNAVSLNGVPVASPEMGGRVVALDVLPTDSLGAVEVTKVNTPDMPADGIGASVNMKSRSAFDSTERQASASIQTHYSDLRAAFSGKINATYADLFNDGRVGFIISPTYQERKFGSNNFEEDGGWTLTTVPGQSTQKEYILNGLAFRQYEILRTRYGLNTGLEFRPGSDTRLALSATYSRFDDDENRYITFLPFSERKTLSALSATAATVADVRRERHDLRMRSKQQEFLATSLEGSHKFGDWQLDGRASFSEGREERPNETSIRFRKASRGSIWSYDFSKGVYDPVITQVGGTSLNDPTLFNELSRLEVVNSTGLEREWTAGINLRRELRLNEDMKASVKSGFLYRDKSKTKNEEVVNFTPASSLGFTYASLYEAQTDYPFFGTQRISADKAGKLLWENTGSFTQKRNVMDSELSDWTSTEDISAVYAMGSLTRGRMTWTAGVRHEHTKFSNTGNEVSDESAVKKISARSSNGKTLPSIIARYDLTKSTVIRASLGKTLARPEFEQSALQRSVNTEDSTITQGNPSLRPLESTNYDFSVEQYFKSLGMFSASLFRKDITNFVYLSPLSEPDANGFETTTYLNGEKGNVRGLELAWQMQFHFLPAGFDALGLMANYTMTESESLIALPGRVNQKLPFIGQSEDIGNLALTWERKGLFLRAALNFRSPRLREDEPLGGSAAEDRWVDRFKQLDLTASYKLDRNWEVFAEMLNVTNEPFRVYFGADRKLLVQHEEYGWSANAGLRWKL